MSCRRIENRFGNLYKQVILSGKQQENKKEIYEELTLLKNEDVFFNL
jgi:hypothetical protein